MHSVVFVPYCALFISKRPAQCSVRHLSALIYCGKAHVDCGCSYLTWSDKPLHSISNVICIRHGIGSHFVTQRPSGPRTMWPGDPVDPVTHVIEPAFIFARLIYDTVVQAYWLCLSELRGTSCDFVGQHFLTSSSVLRFATGFEFDASAVCTFLCELLWRPTTLWTNF